MSYYSFIKIASCDVVNDVGAQIDGQMDSGLALALLSMAERGASMRVIASTSTSARAGGQRKLLVMVSVGAAGAVDLESVPGRRSSGGTARAGGGRGFRERAFRVYI